MQGCMAFLRRKRQKTGRSELLPVVFVQFYCPVSGCVSQSSAPRRKNSAAVAARPPYSRGNITPEAGRTTLATRIARHRPNSTRTSGCTQGAQQQRLGYEHGRQRRHVPALVLPETDRVQVCPQSGQYERDGPHDAHPAQRCPAGIGGWRPVQQLRELDAERVCEPLQRLHVRAGAAGLVIRYGLPRRVHGLRQIVLRQLPAHAGAADVGSNVAHGVHLAQSIPCAGAICHAKNLCARKKPAEANFCRSCLCSFTVRGFSARSDRG